jgi:ABC-type nitrate/sulfonate/bicarbonate transport system substrate-binding protein
LQYIAIGGGYYKQEGLEPESVDVSSGTRQAAAVMGGSAEITQVGFAHTMHAVGRGGALVGIATAFDAYPIALVLSNDAIKRLGITDTMSLDEKIKRVKACASHPRPAPAPTSSCAPSCWCAVLIRRVMCSCSHRRGAPMVAAMQAGSTDGFAFMSPFTNIAVTRGIGQIIADRSPANCLQSRRAVGDHHQPPTRQQTTIAAACRARVTRR